MRSKPLGCLIFALTLSCRGSDAADPTAIRAVIDTNNANAARWYANGHVDSLGNLFAADAWQLPPNSAPLVSRDSIVAFWRTAAAWGRWQFDLRAQDVQVSGPLAVERGQFTLTFSAGPASPIPSVEDRGNYVVLWRREPDGVWRIVWDAPVSTVPLPPPPAK